MIYEGKQKIWSDYQKEIPDDHYFYVRSCIRLSLLSLTYIIILAIFMKNKRMNKGIKF